MRINRKGILFNFLNKANIEEILRHSKVIKYSDFLNVYAVLNKIGLQF